MKLKFLRYHFSANNNNTIICDILHLKDFEMHRCMHLSKLSKCLQQTYILRVNFTSKEQNKQNLNSNDLMLKYLARSYHRVYFTLE